MSPSPRPPVERGTYQRVAVSISSADWTAGTEVEQTEVATSLVAAGQDERVLWARFFAYAFDTAAATVHEWALIKCSAADATQDLSDTATWELLLKRGSILKRGWVGMGFSTYGKLHAVKWEIFNVDLFDGEELRMVWRPVLAGAAQCVFGILEYRLAGK